MAIRPNYIRIKAHYVAEDGRSSLLYVPGEQSSGTEEIYEPPTREAEDVVLRMATAQHNPNLGSYMAAAFCTPITRKATMRDLNWGLGRIAANGPSPCDSLLCDEILTACDDESVKVLDKKTVKMLLRWAFSRFRATEDITEAKKVKVLFEQLMSVEGDQLWYPSRSSVGSAVSKRASPLLYNIKRLLLIADSAKARSRGVSDAIRQCANAEMVFLEHLEKKHNARGGRRHRHALRSLDRRSRR